MLAVGATADNLKGKQQWADPLCNTFSADGYSCLKCAFHAYKDENGACKNVSDWCKTWDEKTGACTSCFEGYGNPVKGVCASTPVVNGGNTGGGNNGGDDHSDDIAHCEVYGYKDAGNKWLSSWVKGCKKICK